MKTLNENNLPGNSGSYINYDIYSSSSDIHEASIPYVITSIPQEKIEEIEKKKIYWKNLSNLVTKNWDNLSVEQEIREQRGK